MAADIAHELRTPVTFDDQASFMSELASDLAKRDTVVVIGVPEFSIHTGRLSVWPWPYMWFYFLTRVAFEDIESNAEAHLALEP